MEKVIISQIVQDLKGHGMEILMDKDGNPIAIFYDGNLPTAQAACSDEPTKKAA